MTVVLAFNERTKSYFLYREASEAQFALVIKFFEEESENFISASVNKLPKNTEYALKPIMKFQTTLGFLKRKESIMKEFSKLCLQRPLNLRATRKLAAQTLLN